ncbi:Flp pilus assembly protein TadG [Sphingomonas sp. BE138]|uniref:pilus assembly protein TadG-related protein n=1 Tax=Sphingomonas sp. BE138 TaxID=2817845 RepID=UPI0028571314|nr:pilus assembly protein TadG-related protein [Sphingomonas sp. BE138]MDR6790538.1 Flp pilus assembly protein TadG [Sphingomonas sp. BE138]
MIRRVCDLLRRLAAERRGGVLMLFAVSLVPMTFAVGMGIDYARAVRLRTKLNAIADAAALGAVSQPMMNIVDDTQVGAAATAMFNGQAAGLEGLVATPKVTVTITHPEGATSRAVAVSYTADSRNAFAGILNLRSIGVGGASTAVATAAPNVDFYLALDTSPSMGLATTSAGMATMDQALGCTFACHSNRIEINTSSFPDLIVDTARFAINKKYNGYTQINGEYVIFIDADGSYIYYNKTQNVAARCNQGGRDACVYNRDGSYVDSYWYAKNKGVRMRVTDERSAIQDLMTLAQQYSDQNKRRYHASLHTFDHKSNFKTLVAMPGPTAAANLSTVSSAASGIDLVAVNDRAGGGRPPNAEAGTEWLFTSFQSVLTQMGSIMPAKSGQGSDQPGDTPQAMLFIVTDGMSDENIGYGRTRTAMRDEQVAQCNAIKARGIRLAILYTEYTPESVADDEPYQRGLALKAIPNIAPQLTKCASPGLLYTVKTDQSMSTALQALFAKAMVTARLTR